MSVVPSILFMRARYLERIIRLFSVPCWVMTWVSWMGIDSAWLLTVLSCPAESPVLAMMSWWGWDMRSGKVSSFIFRTHKDYQVPTYHPQVEPLLVFCLFIIVKRRQMFPPNLNFEEIIGGRFFRQIEQAIFCFFLYPCINRTKLFKSTNFLKPQYHNMNLYVYIFMFEYESLIC